MVKKRTGTIAGSPYQSGNYEGYADRVSMHKDDLEAHRAWVMAKRIHERALQSLSSRPAESRIGSAHSDHLTRYPGDRTCQPVSLL